MTSCHSAGLPVAVELHNDELPLSFLSRVAKANGFQSLVEFCDIVGLDKLKVRSGNERTLSKLAVWTGVPVSRLARFAIGPGRMLNFGGQALRRHQMYTMGMRFCPACVADDLCKGTRRSGVRPYLRASHILKVVVDCPTHGVPLQYRPDEIEFGDDLVGNKPAIVETSELRLVRIPHPANAYFASRIGGQPGSEFLDMIPAYLALELCEVLGELDRVARSASLSKETPFSKESENQIFRGFDIAKIGLPAISIFLSNHVQTAIHQGRSLRFVYSPVWQWLKNEGENPAYSALFSFFRDHAQANVPISRGQAFFGA
ncbi:TniQ family protein [Rhizobium tubonense]|uniref:TniQ domain-containing protein n=1 Tax=Rhizobium tubonense TaxID=484088 RepID=A0A2W4CAW8_9HYPH|nr:TniQ family protein [Rhizobium tubonense]PZM08085.1 hypothetical protein CPY51_30550 [Rhizobium tubonense]